MGKETTIEWCDSTVNPTDFQCCGCELWNPKAGVKECYAGRFAERRGGIGAFDKPVVLKPGRMAAAARWSDLRDSKRKDKPWLDGRPRVIFIGDMADVFQPDVPFDYLYDEIISVVTSEAGRRHVWMLLTKQAKRLAAFAGVLAARAGRTWPENLWPGVSVTSNRTTWRIDELLKVRSDYRFISYEPAWEYVDFSRWTWQSAGKDEEGLAMQEPSYKLRLIITGGESGKGAEKHPYNIAWGQQTIDLCEHDHVDCFVKQLGAKVVYDHGAGLSHPCEIDLKHPKGGDWREWPESLRVRQFPEVHIQSETGATPVLRV